MASVTLANGPTFGFLAEPEPLYSDVHCDLEFLADADVVARRRTACAGEALRRMPRLLRCTVSAKA